MRKIEIEGYKSIERLSLPLKSINILIGANGSGKSNFLSFFHFLKQLYNQNLQEYIAIKGIDTLLHNGQLASPQLSARIFLENDTQYSFTLKKGESGFIFTEEVIVHINHQKNAEQEDIAGFTTESNLKHHTSDTAKKISSFFGQLQKHHFHDTGEHSPFSRVSSIDNDIFYLYETGTNLAAFLYHIKHDNPVAYNLIVKTIQGIAPYFQDFFFKPEPNGDLKLRWQNKHSNTIYGVNSLSDGTIRFIALTALFMQPTLPETITIDEPELGLHPMAIAKLAGLIKLAAAKNCQVIIATQSTDLISHFEPEDIITVDQINGSSVFERLDSEKLGVWLDDYSIDDLWKQQIITTGQLNY
jgi:predicted ATPase